METCPVCDGEGIQLGTLGNLTHYRCQDCGITFSEPIDATNICTICGGEFRWHRNYKGG